MTTKKDFEVLNYLVQKILLKYSNISLGIISSSMNPQEIQEDFLHSAKAIKVLLHENIKLRKYIDQLLVLEKRNSELMRNNKLLYQENKNLFNQMQSINSTIHNSNYNSNYFDPKVNVNEEKGKGDINQPLSFGSKLLIKAMNYKHYIQDITDKFGDDYMLRLINKDTSEEYLDDFSVFLNTLKEKDLNKQYKQKPSSFSNHCNSPKLPLRISKKFCDI